MEKEEFYKKIREKANKIDIDLSVEQMDKLYRYMDLLIEWNEKMNLTTIIEPEEIILKHFIDSLTILKHIKKEDKLVDIGTGAGFPGIPISIACDENKITLVDSLNKRLLFLQEVINQLELKNVEVIHSRAEDFGQNKKYREQFDIATSRAVANLSTLSEYLLPLVKLGGKCLCMKATDIEQEVQNAEKAINILGGKIKQIEKFTLPQSDIGRTIVIIDKSKITPSKFPRKSGMPSKEPIK